jgi:hypothetical protein
MVATWTLVEKEEDAIFFPTLLGLFTFMAGSVIREDPNGYLEFYLEITLVGLCLDAYDNVVTL